MSFEKKAFKDIYASMVADTRQRIPRLSDFEPGSVIRSLYESFSYEMALLYEQLDLVYQAGFVDTAQAAHLDRVIAVLGLKRNEPDFAKGVVTFERDPGSEEEVVIPLATLVMTKEDEHRDPSKKAYLTTEEGRLAVGEVAVEVKIQAEERGKKMTTAAETIVVMPRPVPGVKRVVNKKSIAFLGRDRETDEQLRERAKKALLASGRASATSIENALWGMPGVRDVRQRENFVHYQVTEKCLENLEQDENNGISATIKKKAAEAIRGLKDREYTSKLEFEHDLKTRLGDDLFGNDKLKALIEKHAYNKDYLGPGVIEVYVDGLTNQNAASVEARINDVRAAGVYVILKPAVAIMLQAVLKIDVDARISSEESEALEDRTRNAVEDFIHRLRMGQPLIFSQLAGEVLNIKGIHDLVHFEIETFRETASFAEGMITLTRATRSVKEISIPAGTLVRTATGQEFTIRTDGARVPEGQKTTDVQVRAITAGRAGELARTGAAVTWDRLKPPHQAILAVSNGEPILLERTSYLPENKRIDVKILERFVCDRIRVASREKPLNVHLQLRLSAQVEDPQKARDDIKGTVEDFFSKLKVGQSFVKNELEEQLKQLDIGDLELKISAFPFQSEAQRDVFKIKVSFVEKPVPETIFVYTDGVDLSGKLELVLSLSATAEEKSRVIATVRQSIEDYLESLKPEEDVDLKKVRELAQLHESVLRVDFQPEDCALVKIIRETREPLPGRYKDGTIAIEPFEKVFLSHDKFEMTV